MYKVYRVYPRGRAYTGFSIVAAESAEDANKIIQDFRDSDKHNYRDSYAYSDVYESDLIEELSSNCKGIIHEGFYYRG